MVHLGLQKLSKKRVKRGSGSVHINRVPSAGTFRAEIQAVQSCHVFGIKLEIVHFRIRLDPTRRD